MFGPNVNRGRAVLRSEFHHRERGFMKMYEELVLVLREKWGVQKDFEIVILSGSGTAAMEAFISHYKGRLSVRAEDFENEKFARRWRDMALHYGKYDPKSPKSVEVLFETSQSLYRPPSKDAVISDAVSAFPYYKKPSSPAWVTVSSKILGALPVISVLVIKKSLLDSSFDRGSPSFFNPHLYIESKRNWQTPFTPSIPLFADFLEQTKRMDIKQIKNKIDGNYDLLVEAIGEENIVNPAHSPVMTLKPNILPKALTEKWQLYGVNSGGKIQIFLYSEKDISYRELASDIRKALKK